MANGTIAASQLEMLTQSGTGIITVVPPTTNTNRTLTLPDSTTTVVGTDATQTLTNKTLTSPTLTTPALGTPASGILTSCTGVQYDGFKNRIINGAMVIDQRNAGASVTANDGTFSVDRFKCVATANGKFTMQQNAGSVTPPLEFVNYVGCTSTAATSLGAGDFYQFRQQIEGYNIADLGWGTANAKTVTLSFQVYSSLTGTFGGSVNNSAFNRSYPFSYSIPVANTWTAISVTIAGDTSGTWLKTNTTGLQLGFSLGSGSTYSGTAGAWAGTAYTSATGAVSVVGTNGATFYITGVQLEKGSTATSFDYRPYGTELALCQRYYEAQSLGIYVASDGTNNVAWGNFIKKRVTPTLVLTGFTPTGSVVAVDGWSAYKAGIAFLNVTAITASAEL
jgi:hypothetical protein